MGAAQRSFDRGMHYYVPAMQAGGDLGQLLRQRVNFGKPVASNSSGILAAQSIAAAGSTTAFLLDTNQSALGPFGRALSATASGAATSAVTIKGRDYLGQPMQEIITLNGAVTVNGKKAFRWVDEIDWGATAGTTVDVGYGDGLGLPYVGGVAYEEYANGQPAGVSAITAAVFTDPQTATTGDPRGLYVTNTVMDGATLIEVEIEFTNYVNANGNGGLHGIAHYNG